MSETSPVVDFSQQLLGSLSSTQPQLVPLLGDTINSLGQSCPDVDSFRKQLNRVLREKLANLPVETVEYRIMLDDNDNIEYWMLNLNQHVLPFLGKQPL